MSDITNVKYHLVNIHDPNITEELDVESFETPEEAALNLLGWFVVAEFEGENDAEAANANA